MTTLATLRTRIANDINRTDLTAEINENIITAVGLHNHDLLWIKDERSTATTVASQEFFPSPTGFVGMRELNITINDYRFPLIRKGVTWMDQQFTSASTYVGRPTHWCYQDDQIRLYPIPDTTYELTAHYFKSLDELSASASGSGTSGWLNIPLGEALIRSEAKLQLYTHVIRLPAQQQNMQQEVLRFKRELLNANDRRVSTNRLRKHL